MRRLRCIKTWRHIETAIQQSSIFASGDGRQGAMIVQYLKRLLLRCEKIRRPPIFIVGCGHSGTSLLLNILGSHSHIHAIPKETGLGRKSIGRIWQRRLQFNMLTVLHGKQRWAEKTPKHIYKISRLMRLFPGAKFLIVLRDGRDVAYSIKQRTGSIEQGIRRWIADNAAGEPFWNHRDVYVVRYEDIVTAFEATMRSVLQFLGEEYEAGMADFHSTRRLNYSDRVERPPDASGRHHEQYRNWQINQPLFDGRGRYKAATDSEISMIEDLAGEMLARYGYYRNVSKTAEQVEHDIQG